MARWGFCAVRYAYGILPYAEVVLDRCVAAFWCGVWCVYLFLLSGVLRWLSCVQRRVQQYRR